MGRQIRSGGRCRLPLSFPRQGVRLASRSCWAIQHKNWPVTNSHGLSTSPNGYRVLLQGNCYDGNYFDCYKHPRGSRVCELLPEMQLNCPDDREGRPYNTNLLVLHVNVYCTGDPRGRPGSTRNEGLPLTSRCNPVRIYWYQYIKR